MFADGAGQCLLFFLRRFQSFGQAFVVEGDGWVVRLAPDVEGYRRAFAVGGAEQQAFVQGHVVEVGAAVEDDVQTVGIEFGVFVAADAVADGAAHAEALERGGGTLVRINRFVA